MRNSFFVALSALAMFGCDDGRKQFDLELVAAGCIDASYLRDEASIPLAESSCRSSNPDWSMDEYGCVGHFYADYEDLADGCIYNAYYFSRDYDAYEKNIDIAVLYCAAGVEDSCWAMHSSWLNSCTNNTTDPVGCYDGSDKYLETCLGRDPLSFGGFSPGVLQDCEVLIKAAKRRRNEAEKNDGF